MYERRKLKVGGAIIAGGILSLSLWIQPTFSKQSNLMGAQITLLSHPDPDDTLPLSPNYVYTACQTTHDFNMDVSGLEYNYETIFWFRLGKGTLTRRTGVNGGDYKFGDVKSRMPLNPKAILRNARTEGVTCWVWWMIPDLIRADAVTSTSWTADGIYVIPPSTPYSTTTGGNTVSEPNYETFCLFLNEWSDSGMLISKEEIPGSCWSVEVT